MVFVDTVLWILFFFKAYLNVWSKYGLEVIKVMESLFSFF